MVAWQRRLFVSVSVALGGGLLFGGLLSLGAQRRLTWPWIAGEAGFAMVLALLAAYFAVRNATRILDGELDPDKLGFFISPWTDVQLPFDEARAFELCEAAVRRLEGRVALRARPDRRLVTAIIGQSGWSCGGDLVRIRLGAPSADTGAISARIESRPAWRFNFGDGGRNSRNVQMIAATLGHAVAEHLAEQRRVAEGAAMQAQLDKAKLGLLQAQIEPHFLYNTLANVQSLVRSDAATAERTIGNLIGYLRLILPATREGGFTLGRELDLVRAYLGIMQVRMGDRLKVQVEAAPEFTHVAVPPLIIHTLVENAIKHGLERKPGGGRIRIAVERAAAGALRIVVEDDGEGLRADRHGSGMGLANLRERLSIAFGPAASLAIGANEAGGVTARIEMPFTEPVSHGA